MTTGRSSKIVPHLWSPREAEEAARFYAAIFLDSHVDRVVSLTAEACGWLRDRLDIAALQAAYDDRTRQ